MVKYEPNGRQEDSHCVGTYWQHNTPLPNSLFRLAEYADREHCSLALLGDFNAHSEAWGMSTSNPRGIELEEFIVDKGLKIINEGNVPTWKNRRYASIIDLILASGQLANRLMDWKVYSEEDNHSDHCQIEAVLNGERPARYEEMRNLTGIDWCKFKQDLNLQLADLVN